MTDEIIVTTQQLVEFFEITKKTATRWRDAGCPQIKRGQWDLKQVFDWWWNYIAQDRAERLAGDESLNEAKRLTQWEKLKNERLKNQQLEGNLISREDVTKEWAWRISEVTNGLCSLANMLPPLLEGKNQIEIREIIQEEVWKLRDNFARTGQFCPPVEVEEYE